MAIDDNTCIELEQKQLLKQNRRHRVIRYLILYAYK